MLTKLYKWLLSWADRPGAVPVLGAVSFAESSIFPIPPDPLLMALCLGKPSRSYYYALVTSVSSILGGMLGYLIGYFLWTQLGGWFFAHVPGVTEAGFDRAREPLVSGIGAAIGKLYRAAPRTSSCPGGRKTYKNQ